MRGIGAEEKRRSLVDYQWSSSWLCVRKKHGIGLSLVIRVVPLDNFMIYKDIIRLDRPD